MRLKIAVPEAHVSKPVLDAALESVTALNEQLLADGVVPTFDRALANGLVHWKPEPPGDEHFDSADRVIGRRWGDCDDIAPYKAATLRHTGEDPDARAEVYKSGPNRWHAVVRRGDGRINDPSLQAGMRAGVPAGVFGVAGAVLPLMYPPAGVVSGAYILRPQIALRPHFGEIQARADIPWNWQKGYLEGPVTQHQLSMAALHTAPVAHTALTGAIDDVIELAEVNGNVDPEHVERLCCIADAVDGATYEELVHCYGHDHAEMAEQVVGSLFSGIAKLARRAVKFVPGVGPVADEALSQGSKLFKRHGRRSAPQAPAPAPPTTIVRPSGLAAVDDGGGGARQIIFHFH